MTSLLCRPLNHHDMPEILALDQTCFGGLWSREGYERELDSSNSDFLALEAKSPDGPSLLIGISCLWAILDEAHIVLLGIAPKYQRQGLGQWLLLHLLLSARDRKLTHATLEVRKSNYRARALYEKFDFQIAGERRRYYADDEDALILWKSGLQSEAFRIRLKTWDQHFFDKLSTLGWQIPEQLHPTSAP